MITGSMPSTVARSGIPQKFMVTSRRGGGTERMRPRPQLRFYAQHGGQSKKYRVAHGQSRKNKTAPGGSFLKIFQIRPTRPPKLARTGIEGGREGASQMRPGGGEGTKKFRYHHVRALPGKTPDTFPMYGQPENIFGRSGKN